jgi:hypothetical protein
MYSLLPPEFRKNKKYKQDSKITIGKTMSGDPSIMGSITAHSLAQDSIKSQQTDRSFFFSISFWTSTPFSQGPMRRL